MFVGKYRRKVFLAKSAEKSEKILRQVQLYIVEAEVCPEHIDRAMPV